MVKVAELKNDNRKVQLERDSALSERDMIIKVHAATKAALGTLFLVYCSSLC
jgi:hypothetical protein